jgi:DNA-directed RNA polymerase delta subunit
MTFLNKNAQVKYQDMQIDADYISIDDNKNLIYARGKQDSLGKIIEPVITTQAGKNTKPTNSVIIQNQAGYCFQCQNRRK